MTSHVAVFLGDFENLDTKKTRHYFEERWSFIDCRGHVSIDKTCHFGFGVKIVSATHYYNPTGDPDDLGAMVKKRVIIDSHAWIGSHALLFNCRIGHHAIVGAGAVVKGQEVDPWTMVDGNPASEIGIFDQETGRLIRHGQPRPLKVFRCSID